MDGELTRRTLLATGLAGLAGVALSACGGGGDGGGSASPADSPPAPAPEAGTVTMGADGVQELTIAVSDDYVFVPDRFTVAPGPVRLTLTSSAKQMTHNLLFTPGRGPADITEGIQVLPPGVSDSFEFTVQQPGDYQYECSFHVRLGQIGTMTVTAG
ncbi:plastocyanin/azurin family copper-binding protein [Modestobacter sp. SSW1-42]|uniref:plastocyanin/azurin family copper-binding protein n=1 Tax=Modestobacter sp. SSW1-42 TaxID=596372 RepID=UPI003986D9E0